MWSTLRTSTSLILRSRTLRRRTNRFVAMFGTSSWRRQRAEPKNTRSQSGTNDRWGGSRLVSANFRRLFLFCIEADLCVQIVLFEHFRDLVWSTRLTYLRTALNSKQEFKKISVRQHVAFSEIAPIFIKIVVFRNDFHEISSEFHEMLTEFQQFSESSGYNSLFSWIILTDWG